jgi:glycosyltransferase involved in cell wall biosynthesis
MSAMDDPEVSVIICTLDGAETITGALDSLAAQETDVEWELIVSDNGSTDHTLDVVRAHAVFGDRVRVVDSSDRRGLSHARNVGVTSARGRFVAFVDDDDEVASDWLEELTRALRVHRFVGSRMEYRKLNSPEAMIGRAEFQSDSLGSIFGYTVVNGACGVERVLWKQVGGNDEDLTVSAEDFDFAIRLQRDLDVRPFLAERAVYHHRQRGGLMKSFRQGRRYGVGHATLFARYGPDTVSPEQARRARHMWWWLLSRAPLRPFSKSGAAWARHLGIRIGRLEGSFRQRRWCP